ncbi:Myozenin-2 [Nibea albiflora]|uniref:Myozenin-2 n=1 Tax=Nibea albiflora TaxID=240163 RepID=A0ACB7EPD8_NIBAL|nr:Myozenin-2 [Nibea albiflora]
MMMHSGLDEVTKQRMLQARALSKEARGRGLNLGKKISVPKDVMMEELNLQSNRGSRMFQERQKRAERFTLENTAAGAYNTNNVYTEAAPPMQITPEPQGGKENQAFGIPGKHSLVMNLQKTIAKKGNPDVLAPDYARKRITFLVAHKELHNSREAGQRSAMPFGGGMASKRVIPVISFEAVESQKLPSIAQERMCRRPNFNRAPKGWGTDYYPESNEL